MMTWLLEPRLEQLYTDVPYLKSFSATHSPLPHSETSEVLSRLQQRARKRRWRRRLIGSALTLATTALVSTMIYQALRQGSKRS